MIGGRLAIDAAVVPDLARRLAVEPARLIESFNHEAGLLGMGGNGNPAELIAAGGERATRALELYCYRICKYIGAYLTVLGGCDGIVFCGGGGGDVFEPRGGGPPGWFVPPAGGKPPPGRARAAGPPAGK